MKRLMLVLTLLCLITSPRLSRADEPDEGISTGRYVTSGVIGTVIGLGIGHGIQGRYLPLGLVFTLTEAAGYIAYFADSHSTTDIYGFRSRSAGTLGVIGLITFAGFHIWEIVDVWVGGNRLHKLHKTAGTEFMLPVASVNGVSSPGLSLGWRF